MPHPQILLFLIPQEGKQHLGLLPLHRVFFLLVMPTNLEFTDLHLPVLALSGIPLCAGLGGAAGMQRFCRGGLTSPTAPTHRWCLHLHLWNSKMALGRKGTRLCQCSHPSDIHCFRGTNPCFPPCLSPLLLLSPRWGLSDSGHYFTHLRAE